jgi:Protein of unknown function (DUF2971)
MSKAVADEYKELMHYTTAGGLAGIVSSGCIWATHAAFLNDAEEMTHFFDARLESLAQAEHQKYLFELTKTPSTEEQIKIAGGIEKLAKIKSQEITKTLREFILSNNHPYIFSMSGTHVDRVGRNGLLSQWRGYGVDGGYSLVFNTQKFELLLKQEAELHHYQYGYYGDVFYYSKGGDAKSQPSSDDVAELEEKVRSGLSELIRHGKAEGVESFYQAISALSCLYKHWGFQEEHEVRVIAISVNDDVAKLAIVAGEKRSQKAIHSFVRSGLPVPYLKLFDSTDSNVSVMRLPIERVIVGPHRDSAIRKKAVERLLASNGYECEVVCSEIPYIGR